MKSTECPPNLGLEPLHLEPPNLPRRTHRRCVALLAGTTLLALTLAFLVSFPHYLWLQKTPSPSFFYTVNGPLVACVNTTSFSHAGHIGLQGDTDGHPKRSFFWYFEAEENTADAPIILTMGGGPGTSVMMNALLGQSPCLATNDGLVPNMHRWTEKHNLIALDHPVGAGYSYGTRVNSSRAAAHDVYDFLQKFFVLFPHLAANKFLVSGGSYGGVYVPHIATVIHEQNLLRKSGRGQPGAIHINLDALILSNPFTNPVAHFRWLLQYRCSEHHVYNSTDCKRLYSELPACLDSIDMAFQQPTVENRVHATKLCYEGMSADSHGTVTEDIRRKCVRRPDDPASCHPQFGRIEKILNSPHVRDALRIPNDIDFTALNMEVNAEFRAAGDFIQPHHLMYLPLLAAGIRILHYVGAQDANCPWPGILSFLKLLQTPFQQEFLDAPDVSWGGKNVATVRVAGPGAGNMTFILLAEAGHFTVGDQPRLAKLIVETWVANKPWV
ncbi:alpha/beta-hydrolase [Mycena crocata]|nr:alpha/beta-hydrolase [Mycena crocata]